MRRHPFTALLLASVSLSACAHAAAPPPIAVVDDPPKLAQRVVETPKAVELVQPVAQPPSLPGQWKPLPSALPTLAHEAADPRLRVAQANLAARVQPSRAGYVNAVQVYPFAEGALYQLYAAPGEITDIALEPGETLAGSGPVAAGDTVRWIIGDTESGAGATKRVHILVKPSAPNLATNLVIDTDRRTYHVEMRSDALTYMASVSWSYPADQLIALRKAAAAVEAAQPIAAGVDLEALQFRYAITGDSPPWRPLRAYDDGRQVFIEFPAGIAQGEMPPLWVVGAGAAKGGASGGARGGGELVNYRVHARFMIVDRLFAAAELRLGDKRQAVVRIVRTDARLDGARPDGDRLDGDRLDGRPGA